MSLDSLNINLDDVQESSGGSTPFPPGEYNLSAALYEQKTSSNGNPMLEFEFNVVGPTHAGRKVWDRFVLNNQTAIGRLKSWIIATGGDASGPLGDDMVRGCMGKPFSANIVIEEGDAKAGGGKYPDKNKISSFKKGSASAAAQPQAPQQAQATPAPGLNTTNVDWGG
tara:strand:- start:1956 stop:2459 length:504 start_codon:yes stop_codon:yes gene_type:complete